MLAGLLSGSGNCFASSAEAEKVEIHRRVRRSFAICLFISDIGKKFEFVDKPLLFAGAFEPSAHFLHGSRTNACGPRPPSDLRSDKKTASGHRFVSIANRKERDGKHRKKANAGKKNQEDSEPEKPRLEASRLFAGRWWI